MDDETDGYDAWMNRHRTLNNEVIDQDYDSLHEQHFSYRPPDAHDGHSNAGTTHLTCIYTKNGCIRHHTF